MSALVDHVGRLTVTEGEGAGSPLQVLDWERRFLAAVESSSGDCGLSVARGNGKSTLVAAIADAALFGPLAIRGRGDVVIVASSLQQARISFEHCLGFIGPGRHLLQVRDSANAAIIRDPSTGRRIRCIGSDPRRAHGLAPALVLADEPAQWPPGTADRMRAALRTSMGKVPGSRLIACGTRPASAGHWFSALLERDGGAGVSQVHAAAEGDDPHDPATWALANPSMSSFPLLRHRLEVESAEARADPELLPEFRALRLNMGTSDVSESRLVESAAWLAAEGDAPRSGDYVLGVDLGGSEAMSAAAAWWLDTGRLEALAAFSERPTLQERAQRDSVGDLYERMRAGGELILAGAAGDVVDVVDLLIACLRRWGRPKAIVADTYRWQELERCLAAAEFPAAASIKRRMGFLEGGQDVRTFRQAFGRGHVVPVRSALLRAAVEEARVMSDAAGNWKLCKSSEGGRRQRARDDAIAAAVLAIAVGSRESADRARRSRRRALVIR